MRNADLKLHKTLVIPSTVPAGVLATSGRGIATASVLNENQAIAKASEMATFNDLKPYVGVPRKVRLEREFARERTHNGFILKLSDALVLLQQFHDFYCEGYTLLRVPDITSVRSGQYERYWELMLRAEGLIDNVGISYDVWIQGIGSALTWLTTREQNIAVEIESRESPDDDEFYLGRIVKLTDDAFHFAHFDALGEWKKEAVVIRMDEVTRIQFDTPYINIFSRHLKQPDP